MPLSWEKALRLFLAVLILLAAGIAGLIFYGYSLSPDQRPIQVEVDNAP